MTGRNGTVSAFVGDNALAELMSPSPPTHSLPPPLEQIITNNWDMIHRSKQLQMIFTQRPVIGLK